MGEPAVDDRKDGAEHTRERILDGAMRAIARYGLSKLAMEDVSTSAGVSRGTLYRYFPNRERLLHELAEHEREQFRRIVNQIFAAAPSGKRTTAAVLEQVARYAREHQGFQRILETEPGVALRYLREEFPRLRETTRDLLAPLFPRTHPVEISGAETEDMAGWLTRLLLAVVLFPNLGPEGLRAGLVAIRALLQGEGAMSQPLTSRRRRSRVAGRREPWR